MTAEAPSLRPEELPAVTQPPFLKALFKVASFSSVVSRGNSSVSKPSTGTICSLNLPSAMAFFARSWLL